jgi:hypothetical protein
MEKGFEPLNGPMSSTSSEDLLEEKQQLEDEFLENAGLLGIRRRASWWKRLLPVASHAILILLYTTVTLYLLHRNNEMWKHGPNLIHCKSYFGDGWLN